MRSIPQDSASVNGKTVQIQKTGQKGIQQGVIQGETLGASGKPDRVNLRQISNSFRLYCSGKEGDISTQFTEHQSDNRWVKNAPAQVKGVLPDRRVFKQNQQWGLVVLEVEIDQEGNVIRACALKGDPELARRTVDEVLKWKYEPVKIDGKPSPARFIVRVNYK